MKVSPRIAIVGAGPAGLVAALVARKLGLDATLFEQAPDFSRIGGGVLVHSNGQRVLEQLGLLASFEPKMRTTQQFALELPSTGLRAVTDFATVQVPYNRGAVVLRADLQEHLLAAARAQKIPVHFGRRVEGVTRADEGLVLRFAGGEESFDAVVASDGLHSAVRTSLGLKAHEEAIGEAYLRCIAKRRSETATIRELWGEDGRKVGICPLPGDETYVFCSVPLGRWKEIREGGLSDWIESYAPFGEEVVALLRAADYERANYDELRQVEVERWTDGRAFLIGDAAHAMTPHLGQGANSAMTDALVLMRLLAKAAEEGASLEDAGRVYESVRRKFVTRIQRTARKVGEMALWTSPTRRWLRNRMLSLVAHVPSLQRPNLPLMTGYNPREQAYFEPG